ncbi:hypothetical protein [Aneurinibacillus aneurinilyticus]|nr:hypothetical protein [Aneurinibacillus aneurinilyticus]MED0708927.1 hypothetical protein [Aneurinibacillus aneurinilyticus]MED0722900.1 hypothetical protein [Aneurinibacillus aneurinilyticus]MED0732599.1 hypothetical protein [Aneurinibacillus aneurinilyticus]MED0740674.1 hypothetical protein [Aneurinibacillus aneurinilyticus]
MNVVGYKVACPLHHINRGAMFYMNVVRYKEVGVFFSFIQVNPIFYTGIKRYFEKEIKGLSSVVGGKKKRKGGGRERSEKRTFAFLSTGSPLLFSKSPISTVK